MIIVLSPAKSLDFESTPLCKKQTKPAFVEESTVLISKLKKLSKKKIAELMNLSESLAQLNYERYAAWEPQFSLNNSKQSVFAFKGDAYRGLNIESFTEDEIAYAQDHLRILSGLHGLLRPLDLVRPYRLEMGTRLKVRRANNLYQFWGEKITKEMNQLIEQQNESILINLASAEYFKAIQSQKLKARIITPIFKELKNGEYKTIMTFAKQARGMMTSYILKNKLVNPDEIKLFDKDGYCFSEPLSDGDNWVFIR